MIKWRQRENERCEDMMQCLWSIHCIEALLRRERKRKIVMCVLRCVILVGKHSTLHAIYGTYTDSIPAYINTKRLCTHRHKILTLYKPFYTNKRTLTDICKHKLKNTTTVYGNIKYAYAYVVCTLYSIKHLNILL